ncbi:MAG: hypothetical protein ABW278_03045 [Steroidobacteraceae bacterium]
MKPTNSLLLIAAGTALAACGGSNHDGAMGGGGSSPPPSPPAPTNFTRLVSLQVVEPLASDQTTKPILVDAIDFSFPDDDNPAAFDAVIASAP